MQQTVDNVIAVRSYPSSAEERPDSLAMQFLHSGTMREDATKHVIHKTTE